jgi:hypothetical protein
MRYACRLSALLATVVAISCADPSGTQGPDDAGSPTAPTIAISPQKALIGIGEELPISASIDALPDLKPGETEWTTSDSTIVALSTGAAPLAIGLREGDAVLTARFGGMSASIPVAVRADAAQIVIEDFHVLEDSYSSNPQIWEYMPKLRLRASTTRPAASIVGWELVIPGVSGTWGCRSNVSLSPDLAFELFGEAYGDYSYQLPSLGERAALDARASIRVRLLTSQGTTVFVRAWGPVVPKTSEPAYEGRIIPGLCVFP